MRIIALDVHRSFAQTAILENGKLRDAGKIDLESVSYTHLTLPTTPYV